MTEPNKMINVYHERLRSITDALNTLSPHFLVEIKRESTESDCRGDIYKEADYYVDCFLKEYYKDNHHITFN